LDNEANKSPLQIKRGVYKNKGWAGTFLRSTVYDPLMTEEDELEQWKQKKRKGFYKLAIKMT